MDDKKDVPKTINLTKLLKGRFPMSKDAKNVLGEAGLLMIAYSCTVLADKSTHAPISKEDIEDVLRSLKFRNSERFLRNASISGNKNSNSQDGNN